jgi:DNA-binding CsgD family transcriptional regulator
MRKSTESVSSTAALAEHELKEKESHVPVNPLGDVAVASSTPSSFDLRDIFAQVDETIPAWQRETPRDALASHDSTLERLALVRAADILGQTCLIFDKSGQIVAGSAGWSNKLLDSLILSNNDGFLSPNSSLSAQEFLLAVKALFGDFTIPSVPLALRDLDGWVTDVIHIKRVGPSNPTYAFTMLPKSMAENAAIIARVAAFLGLTTLEVDMVDLIVRGCTDREIALKMGRKQGDIKRALAQLTNKFRVRQKSDIVKLLASFP